jgi:hypothetical protein
MRQLSLALVGCASKRRDTPANTSRRAVNAAAGAWEIATTRTLKGADVGA